MAPFFQVEGWGLENKEVVAGTVKNKKKLNKQKKSKQNENHTREEVNKPNKKEFEKNDQTVRNKKRKHDQQDDEDDADNGDGERPLQKQDGDKPNNKKSKKSLKDKKKKQQQPNSESKSRNDDDSAASLLMNTKTKLTPLQQKMLAKLSGSRFRWINEQLYTIKSKDALDLITKQPELFDEYHKGFRSQVESWPENPVDVFVKMIVDRGSFKNVNAPGGLPGIVNKEDGKKKVVIADMGCGEAQLAYDVEKFLNQAKSGAGVGKKGKKFVGAGKGGKFAKNLNIDVHSFDLKKANEKITVADIRNVPLPDQSCTIVIFCLALMGTNFLDFIKEAYRLLAPRGELWISEIKSRLQDEQGEEFIRVLKTIGFFHKNTDDSNKMFTRFEFFKPSPEVLKDRKDRVDKKTKFIEKTTDLEEIEERRETLPEGEWLLKPCIYKRR